jgi:hypothetical protein
LENRATKIYDEEYARVTTRICNDLKIETNQDFLVHVAEVAKQMPINMLEFVVETNNIEDGMEDRIFCWSAEWVDACQKEIIEREIFNG